jgi:hypothetical protein
MHTNECWPVVILTIFGSEGKRWADKDSACIPKATQDSSVLRVNFGTLQKNAPRLEEIAENVDFFNIKYVNMYLCSLLLNSERKARRDRRASQLTF